MIVLLSAPVDHCKKLSRPIPGTSGDARPGTNSGVHTCDFTLKLRFQIPTSALEFNIQLDNFADIAIFYETYLSILLPRWRAMTSLPWTSNLNLSMLPNLNLLRSARDHDHLRHPPHDVLILGQTPKGDLSHLQVL